MGSGSPTPRPSRRLARPRGAAGLSSVRGARRASTWAALALVATRLAGCASGASTDGAALPSDGADATTDRPFDATPAWPDAPPRPPDASRPPDAPPTPDAAGPPDAPASCTTRQWIDLLANGGFDGGHVAWEEIPTNGVLVDSSPVGAQGGAWVAWLLGVNGADDQLAQPVTVPPSATQLRLRGHRCFTTVETSTTTRYDVAEAAILGGGGGAVLEVLASWSNLDAGTYCSWAEFTLPATSSYAGQTVRLAFHAIADSNMETSFWLDTLALEAYACP